MDLQALSNSELVEKLETLRGNEREITLSVMYHLIELERRGIYRELGFSSLFDYCVRSLGYSEGSAGRRINGARVIRDNPELAGHFLAGKVTLSTISMAARSIKAKDTQVEEILGKSKKEIEVLIAYTKPVEKIPKEVIKPVIIKAPALPIVPEAPKEERYKLQFSITKDCNEKLEEARNKLSHTLGKDASLEAMLETLLDRFLKPKTRRSKVTSSVTRYIPRAVKREVFKRDNGQCCYQSKEGIRCTEKRYLHYDHIKPFSLGGKSEASNLRLLCSSHNQLLSEKTFQRSYRHLAEKTSPAELSVGM